MGCCSSTAARGSTPPAQQEGAAAGVQPQSQTPAIAHVEIWGNHGCPFFVTATKLAETLHARSAVSKVVIHRVGHRHTPEWSSPSDKAPFKELFQDSPRTQLWDGSSPRVIVDNKADAAMGCTPFMLSVESLLQGAEFGLPAFALARMPMLWSAIRTSKSASALWLIAYQDGGHADFFSADPAGRPLRGERGGLVYEDLDASEYLSQPLTTAGAVLEQATAKIQAAQRDKVARFRARRAKVLAAT